MKWQNIIEAITAAPSILLDLFIRSGKLFYMQEQEIMRQGEYDEETDE